MTNDKRRGFTLLEIMIVVAVLSVFIALTFPPLVSSLRIIGHESAMLAMDQSANTALNAVTAELRQAILPIKINDSANREVTVSDAAILADIRDYGSDAQSNPLSLARFMNNAAVGFGANGKDWLDVLEKGADFIPFAVPVPYVYADGTSSVTTLDSSMLPQLGIFSNGGEKPENAASYFVDTVAVSGGTETRTRLLWDKTVSGISGVHSIHPSLAQLDPGDFDLDPTGLAGTIDIAADRYKDTLALPPGADKAYGVIRFVPHIDASGKPHTISEREGFDLNEDGVVTDSYALGRIEMLFFPVSGAAQRIVVSGNTVLLQLNTDSASHKPLFSLRRKNSGGYVVDITMLLCDGIAQQSNVISFGSSTPFIVRRYASSVELRNMTFK